MNFEQYVPLAIQSAKPLNSKLENVGHAIIGLLSEQNELIDAIAKEDKVNIKEELSDKTWYTALLAHSVVVNFDFFTHATRMRVSDEMNFLIIEYNLFPDYAYMYIVSKNIDIIKKAVIYNKEISEKDLSIAVFSIYFAILELMESFNIDESDALSSNIKKLQDKEKGRYKTGAYTDAEAVNRNTDSERELLEGGE